MSPFNKSLKIDTESEDGFDRYQYVVHFQPFRIEQIVNGITTMVANKKDTLMFEDYSSFYAQRPLQRLVNGHWQLQTNLTNDDIRTDCFYPVLERLSKTFLDKHYSAKRMVYNEEGIEVEDDAKTG